MDRIEILKGIVEVFNDVFENHNVIIAETTTANDIEEWDSLSNIELLVAIEKRFGIKFKSSDIESLRNVGDLENIIYSKIN